MRLARVLAVLARSTALAAAAAAAAFLTARFGFRRDYYVAALLPLFMAAYALTAWFLYLREDGFVRVLPGEGKSVRASPESGPDALPEVLPGRAPIDLSLFAPRDGGLVERAGESGAAGQRVLPDGESARELRRVFLCAAAELGLLATGLYFFAGLGASFFL